MTEADRLFNRSINFYVIRCMWGFICGRNNGLEKSLYEVLGISRNRFNKVLNGDTIRYKRGEIDRLQAITGLPRDIFLGESHFSCPYKVMVHDKTRNSQITDKTWKDFFDLRYEGTSAKHKATLKAMEEEIKSALKKVNRSDRTNKEFFALCYFLEVKKPVAPTFPDEALNGISAEISRLSFALLDSCSIDALGEVASQLNEKYELVKAVITCKRAKLA